MSDRAAKDSIVARTPEPRTRESLARDLRALGIEAGMALVVHASLGRIGWVVGGARSVIEALMEVLTPDGTLMMPAFSEQLSDPAQWRDFEVPDPWLDPIRRHMPPFDPRRTPTQDMGQIAEEFRTWPGVERSGHPIVSLAAWGRHKKRLMAKHSLDWPLGEESPLGAFYELDGHILLLGVGHDRNSSLHLAETRATQRRTTRRRVPVQGKGGVGWLEIMDVADDLGRLFPRLGADFEATGQARPGRVGSADSRLMPQRALADFATAWFDRELSSD